MNECICKTCNHNVISKIGICKALGDDYACSGKCESCYGVKTCSSYQSKAEANLQFQTSRADGATIALQELQAELDGMKQQVEEMKPFANVGKAIYGYKEGLYTTDTNIQKLQTEIDRLKPWADQYKLLLKILKDNRNPVVICSDASFPPEICERYCGDHCPSMEFCQKRKELEGEE